MTAQPVVPPHELENIDLADPRLHAENDLSEVWRHLREERPFYWQPPRGSQPGFWVVTRHADATAVYKDRENFTAEQGNVLPMLVTGGDSAARTMLAVTDGVRHTQMRAILTRAFSPRMLMKIKDTLTRTVDRLLADAAAGGNCDFATDVSGNVPLAAICDLLAVPEADRRYLLNLTGHVLSSDYADAPAEEGAVAKNEILLYFADLAETRRGSDETDVVSLLANSTIDGRPLNAAELMANCYGLIIGGDETGRHAITGGLLALMEHRDQWQALKRGEADLKTATEEVLRWTVPPLHGGRYATADTVVNGDQLIKAGEIVSVWFASANRDERTFPDPDRFDLNRTPNKHLTFATGSHYCLGHFLARMEVEAVLDGLRRTISDFEQTAPEKWIYSSVLQGMSSLPVSLKADDGHTPQPV
ncbi:cytochrome P450 [Kitasatospora sp. DSM 101779]|uniref:Cytochrome P450 n=1 Tax=Kitasatospora sp. 152608 TaxID=1769566 RepID=A0A0U2QZW7_9ACTN|nr:cytochrome P450 [Kitasatospora sp. DSM 101779]ALT05964.1 cytochrome P450 [Kitasatospora sp. 152608]MCU7825051.1 cytochrome P450 [Kitasatospora sp. DSM 101779]